MSAIDRLREAVKRFKRRIQDALDDGQGANAKPLDAFGFDSGEMEDDDTSVENMIQEIVGRADDKRRRSDKKDVKGRSDKKDVKGRSDKKDVKRRPGKKDGKRKSEKSEDKDTRSSSTKAKRPKSSRSPFVYKKM